MKALGFSFTLAERARITYWRVRWAVWDTKEWLLVKWILDDLGRSPVIYVHPNGRSAAVAKIVRIPEADADTYDHSHLEGYGANKPEK